MSLWDVDKSGDNRTAPLLNQADQVAKRMAVGTNSVNYTTDQTNPATAAGLFTANMQLVRSGTIVVSSDGASGTSTVTTVSHPLGYAPFMLAAINNATVTGIATPVNLLLPHWLNASLAGADISFLAYATAMVDASNIYIYTLNKTGTLIAYSVTYYLYRQQAVN